MFCVASSQVCLHNSQPSSIRYSCSSYFSQVSLIAVFTHRTDCYDCFQATSHYPDRYWQQFHSSSSWSRDSARTSLYSTSCSLPAEQGGWVFYCQLNCCFMIASLGEHLGSKLAAYRHHGRASAASWFKSMQIKGASPWIQLCLECRDVSGMLYWSKCTQTHPVPFKNQQQHTRIVATSIHIQKCNTGNENCLHNPPMHYSIYYMNHSKEVYMADHTTLNLGYRTLQLDIPMLLARCMSIVNFHWPRSQVVHLPYTIVYITYIL